MKNLDHKIFNVHPIEVLSGGRHKLLLDNYEAMFQQLQQFGAELAFFMDGLTPDDKRMVWLKRQDDRYKKGIHCYNQIDDGVSVKRGSETGGTVLLYRALATIAKSYGSLHTSTRFDCDRELVHYANQHSTLAIVTGDSDFLIFPGMWQCWNLIEIEHDMSEIIIHMVELSRTILRHSIKLDDYRISIFASLIGNDTINRYNLQAFHKTMIDKPKGKRFRDIAALVRREFPGDGPLHMSETDVVQRLAIVPKLGNILSLIRKSITFYSPIDDADDRQNVYIDLLYRVQNKKPLQIALSIFDLRRPDFRPYFEMIKPMIQRQIGLAMHLQNQPEVEPWKVLTKVSHKSKYGIEFISPDYPVCKSK